MDNNMPVISAKNLNLWYGDFKALKGISLDVGEQEITALIGPSGCGKSTFLKTLNRMNDLVPNVRIEGGVRLRGEDIFSKEMQLTDLRRRVGMVFQKANPFPMSIYDNITYGPKLHGVRNKAELDELVESSLRGAALWDEVKDRLKKSALGLSGGQQQRLCIARALAVQPEVLLMDEAFSALDPLIRVQMQDELLALQSKMKKTIVFITHDLEEAVKLGDRIAIMRDGEIQQTGTSEEILTAPANEYVRCFVENVDRSRIVTAAAIMVDKPMVARLGKEGPEVLTRKMRERKTTVLPVVDPDGILVGEVRLEDLLRLRKEHILHIDPVIKKEVHSVLSDTVVEDILPLMTKTNSPIWVVNEKREFEGMVPLASLIIEVTGKDRKEINEIIQNAIEL